MHLKINRSTTHPLAIACLGTTLAFCSAVQANDSSVTGIGGRWRMLTKEHPNIRMVSETVDIYIREGNKVTTDARFVFHNDGKATSVQMGFPETGFGDIDAERARDKTTFKTFATWADGVPIKAQRHLVTSGEEDIEALWVKTLPFKAGQTRHVRVLYQSDAGGQSTFPYNFVTYDFTGGNWRGKVDSSVLTVHLEVPGTYLVGGNIYRESKEPLNFKRDERNFIYTWKNWQAQDGFVFNYGTTLRDWMSEKGVNEFQMGSRTLLPVKIDIPGKKRDESKVGYIPLGVMRNGQLFISLNNWAEGFGGIKLSYDTTTHATTARSDTRSASFTAGKNGVFSVQDISETPKLFVPAKTLAAVFGTKFDAQLSQHILNFSK